jgi:hypothetical protein
VPGLALIDRVPPELNLIFETGLSRHPLVLLALKALDIKQNVR